MSTNNYASNANTMFVAPHVGGGDKNIMDVFLGNYIVIPSTEVNGYQQIWDLVLGSNIVCTTCDNTGYDPSSFYIFGVTVTGSNYTGWSHDGGGWSDVFVYWNGTRWLANYDPNNDGGTNYYKDYGSSPLGWYDDTFEANE